MRPAGFLAVYNVTSKNPAGAGYSKPAQVEAALTSLLQPGLVVFSLLVAPAQSNVSLLKLEMRTCN
jgi:hypothetical protein